MISPLYGQLSPLRIPTSIPFDESALAYIAAVEAADGAALEDGVKSAINSFVVGCKSDGIWSAIKASCILAGSRTLSGALKPLVGTAPPNANFVTADYNRKTGLKGNGTTKYLNSNRNNNADPQNSQHISVYQTELSTAGGNISRLISGRAPSTATGSSQITCSHLNNNNEIYSRYNGTIWSVSPRSSAPKFIGCSRGLGASYQYRVNNSTLTRNDSSGASSSTNFIIFSDPRFESFYYSNARASFYSIGEHLDLAKLDTRVSTLMTALAAAIQ